MPDFVGSIMVFAVLIVMFFFSWNSIVFDQTAFEEGDEMRVQGKQTLTFLISTPGYPEGWSSSNVEIPGFAEPDHVLQQEKLEEFDEIGYDRQTDLLQAPDFYLRVETEDGSSEEGSLGGMPVAYVVGEGAQFSSLKFLHSLNRSEIEWDLYWPSNSNEEDLDDLTARNVYNHTSDSPQIFDDAIENASNEGYSSIISEDSNVESGDLANSDELVSWVENGGSFTHTEEYSELVNSLFDVEQASDSTEEGTVEKVSPLMNSSYEEGDFVDFDDDQMAFENPDTVFVRDIEAPNGCLACGWNVGDGKLYYIQDTFSDSGGFSTSFTDADKAFGLEVFFGKRPQNSDTVVPFTRSVLLNTSDGTDDAQIRYVVWE